MKCPKYTDPCAVVTPAQLGIQCPPGGESDAPGLSEYPCPCVDQATRRETQPSCEEASSKITQYYKLADYKQMPYPGMRWEGKQWSMEDVVQLYQQELMTNGPFFVGFVVYDDFANHWKE